MPFWRCIGLGLDTPLAPKTKSCQGFGVFSGGGRDNAETEWERVVGRVPRADSANDP